MAIRYGEEREIKKYYSISEVCSISGIEPATLRYWEEKFPQLSPIRNRAGNRTYSITDFQLVQYIKFLVYIRHLEDAEVRTILAGTKKSSLEELLKSTVYSAGSPMQTQLELEQKRINPTIKNKIKDVIALLKS